MPKQLDLTNATVEEIAQYALENADMSCVDDAVVFLGDSGVGKSSLLLRFAVRFFQLLCTAGHSSRYLSPRRMTPSKKRTLARLEWIL